MCLCVSHCVCGKSFVACGAWCVVCLAYSLVYRVMYRAMDGRMVCCVLYIECLAWCMVCGLPLVVLWFCRGVPMVLLWCRCGFRPVTFVVFVFLRQSTWAG